MTWRSKRRCCSKFVEQPKFHCLYEVPPASGIICVNLSSDEDEEQTEITDKAEINAEVKRPGLQMEIVDDAIDDTGQKVGGHSVLEETAGQTAMLHSDNSCMEVAETNTVAAETLIMEQAAKAWDLASWMVQFADEAVAHISQLVMKGENEDDDPTPTLSTDDEPWIDPQQSSGNLQKSEISPNIVPPLPSKNWQKGDNGQKIDPPQPFENLKKSDATKKLSENKGDFMFFKRRRRSTDPVRHEAKATTSMPVYQPPEESSAIPLLRTPTQVPLTPKQERKKHRKKYYLVKKEQVEQKDSQNNCTEYFLVKEEHVETTYVKKAPDKSSAKKGKKEVGETAHSKETQKRRKAGVGEVAHLNKTQKRTKEEFGKKTHSIKTETPKKTSSKRLEKEEEKTSIKMVIRRHIRETEQWDIDESGQREASKRIEHNYEVSTNTKSLKKCYLPPYSK